MASYYFDTSALAKRYVVEIGSSWVQAVVAHQSGQTIYTSVLTQPEIVSAIQRRVREGNLEADEALGLAQHGRPAALGTHLQYLHISGRNHCWKKGFHPFGRHTTGEIGS